MGTMTQPFEEAVQQIAALGSSLIIIAIALSIVPYILFAIGLGSVARACRIGHSWMSWLPIARKHLLTEVADLRRVQVGKPQKLTAQFEIMTFLCVICVIAMARFCCHTIRRLLITTFTDSATKKMQTHIFS